VKSIARHRCRTRLSPLFATLLPSLGTMAQTAPPPRPDAVASDPATMGCMACFPPPPDRVIRVADGSAHAFPQLRWSFANFRRLVPTSNVSRGLAAPVPPPWSERDDLDGVSFQVLGTGQTMTWGQSLLANYTDGILVLHKRRIVYERHFGVFRPEGQHIAMSATKSFFGTIGAMLVAGGTLDANAPASKYVPELKDSAFGDATVRRLLDMTTGLQYGENYADLKAEVRDHVRAGNVPPRPPGWAGPKTFYEFLLTVKKQGHHGEACAYKTVSTDALGWVIARATGLSVGGNLQQRIWSELGAEQDAYFNSDMVGTEFAGGGLNTGLRDLARFGEMIRLDGRFNGRQIVPKAVVDDIRRGADQARFTKAGYALLHPGSSRNLWWASHNEHGAFSARGVHWQPAYVDPKAEKVIARYASFPLAAYANIDPTSLPAYHALAKHLVAHPR
jgi:CubicO group peptidase (beta-lactamase class C family)